MVERAEARPAWGVVELVGPAGVGKSTVSRALTEVFPNAVGLTAYRATSIGALARSPWECLRALRFLYRAGGPRFPFTKTGLNWLVVSGALLHGRGLARRRKVVVLFDQLVLQALRRVARHSGRSVAELTRAYADGISTADAIVTVWAPMATVRSRRLDRGDPPAELAELESATSFRRGWFDTRRGIRILAARRIPRPSLLHLDGRRPIEENRKKLEALVESMRGRAP